MRLWLKKTYLSLAHSFTLTDFGEIENEAIVIFNLSTPITVVPSLPVDLQMETMAGGLSTTVLWCLKQWNLSSCVPNRLSYYDRVNGFYCSTSLKTLWLGTHNIYLFAGALTKLPPYYATGRVNYARNNFMRYRVVCHVSLSNQAGVSAGRYRIYVLTKGERNPLAFVSAVTES